MKKQSFVVGAIVLTIASFFAKVIGAIYRIPLTSILGAEGLGLYQMVFPLYSMLLVLCSTGVPNAIAKMIASGDDSKNRTIIYKSILFFGAISLCMSVALILLSKFISIVQGNKDAWLIYSGVAPAVFFVGVLSVFRGYFQGKQNIVPTSISLIVEQVFKLLFGLLFSSLLIKKGIIFGAFGAILGVTLSEVFALLVILFQYLMDRKRTNIKKNINVSISTIFKTTIPMTVSSMIMPLTLLIDSFLIINLLKHSGFSTSVATNLYGLLTGVVNSLINLPVVLSMSIATMVIPVIAKLFSKNQINCVEDKASLALKLVILIAIPCVIVFYVFPNDIIYFLFKNGLKVGEINEFQISSKLLQIGSLSILFISLLQVATTILQAINKAKIPVYNMIGACFLKVMLTFILVLIPSINIYGAMISTLVCYIVCAVLNLQYLFKTIKIRLSMQFDIILPIISGTMMVASMYFIKSIINVGAIQTLTMFLIGAITYLMVLAICNYGYMYDISTFKRGIKNKYKKTHNK